MLTEVTWAEYAERGSIDLLAWHPEARALLVIQVKTEVASAEETLRRHDAKVRLAPTAWRKRGGEAPASVSRLLVVADGSTNRRRIAMLDPTLRSAYPADGLAVRHWLRAPHGPVSGLLFVRHSDAVAPRGRVTPTRVRPTRATASETPRHP